MPAPPLPPNETDRLAALRRLDILDTPTEAAFDRIVSLVSELLDAPIAAISLIDEHREWFKACVGTDTRQAERNLAFCAYTILTDELLIVEDATADPRFRDNPQVTEGGIRFYAGAPLRTSTGFNIGALCVKDTRARALSDREQRILKTMGSIVVDEMEFRLASEQAAASARAKSQFLANMSHEVRTPMNAIIGMTDLVLDGELTTDQRECLALARSSAESLLTILNDILDLSKIEAGKMELRSGPLRPHDVVGDILQAMSATCRSKDLELICDIAPDVPQGLCGDADRLRQVIVNLLSNAIKFTERGEIIVSVAVAEDHDIPDDLVELHFTVADTGIGIEPEQQRGVFDAFAQADGSITRTFGGTGLGLSISSRLVSLMGGRIWVESEPGRGSRFHFTARLARDVAAVADTPQPPPELRVPSAPGATNVTSTPAAPTAARAEHPLQVLLVEDNVLNQRLAVRVLERRGHLVTLASNGQDAIALLDQRSFDAILMDLQMPVMDGIEATRLIRARPTADASIPIIAMTAHAMAGDRERCLEGGMNDYVSKPIEPRVLYRTLEATARTGRGVTRTTDADAVTLDTAALVERVCGSFQVIGELSAMFEKERTRLFAQLETALDAGDGEGATQAAHAVKGAVVNLSGVACHATAARIERLAKAGDLDGARALMTPLRDELAALAAALDELTKSPDAALRSE